MNGKDNNESKPIISLAYLIDGVLDLPEPVVKEDWGVKLILAKSENK